MSARISMRLGHTSAIQFVSRIITSAAGFLATLYFARVVGSEVLGTYFLLLSAVAWISLLVDAGVSESVAKRMSEGRDPGAYFQLGLLLVGVGVSVLVLLLLALSRPVTDYVEHPLATFLLVVLVVSGSTITIVRSGLSGSHNVHVAGVLMPVQSLLRIGLQVGAVTIGLGLVGLVYGWALSAMVVAAIGILYLVYDLEYFPTRHLHGLRRKVAELYSFAKYAWLGSVKAKTNNYVDILILGIFVPNGLIGVYAVCWNIASFLTIFGSSISATLFPEISHLDQQDDEEEIAVLLRKSIQYTGMFVIPGLFGGVLLGGRILKLYGPDFIVGTEVLFLLIIAVWVFDYQKQLTNVLKGMDRPDLDFRVNGVFIGTNVVANVVLIQLIGWVGAAVATVLSSFLSMVYAYYVVSRMIEVILPYREVGGQVLASMLMSVVVLALEYAEVRYSVVNNNFVTVLALVAVGAMTYMLVLVSVSPETRRTIIRNLNV